MILKDFYYGKPIVYHTKSYREVERASYTLLKECEVAANLWKEIWRKNKTKLHTASVF